MTRIFIAAVGIVCFVTTAFANEPSRDWPRWRGPKADGVADNRTLPTRWSPSENIRWSVKLPGWGTSSPVVYGGRVFVTSDLNEEGKKSLLTLCFDRADGRELWRHDFGFGVNQRVHEKSNLAVDTPAVTADGVYVAFGNADIARYSHEGKLQWVNRYIPRFGDPKMGWGFALSPLVLEDSILFPWDHHSGPCFLIGLNSQTGEIAWKNERRIANVSHATTVAEVCRFRLSCRHECPTLPRCVPAGWPCLRRSTTLDVPLLVGFETSSAVGGKIAGNLSDWINCLSALRQAVPLEGPLATLTACPKADKQWHIFETARRSGGSTPPGTVDTHIGVLPPDTFAVGSGLNDSA